MSRAVNYVAHQFLRNPNFRASPTNRIANRFDPFNNTLTCLEDPKNGRSLYLIGTTNSSTTLACRTEKLLKEVSPDLVYAQADQTWWKHAQHTDVKSQKTFTKISRSFPTETYLFEHNIRGTLYRFRYNSWVSLFGMISKFTEEFQPFVPGLEMYHALKYAQNNNVQSVYGGLEFDPMTIDAFRVQNDLSTLKTFLRGLKIRRGTSSYNIEHDDFFNTLDVRGAEAFGESIDRSRANFAVAMLSKVAPLQKKIMIDERDYRIFRDLYDVKGKKKIVAVVNQWHTHGIETHWRRATGTEIVVPHLSPIADMPIDEMQDASLVNAYLRDFTSKNAKTETATELDMFTGYVKDLFEPERHRSVNPITHHDVPEPGQAKKKDH